MATAPTPPIVEITPWKHDAACAYSVTYDEATIDAISNSYPIHQEYGIPGHVCAVTGYLGTQRIERGTSMREVFHMSAEQLRFLIERDWTVSSHSHSHCPTRQDGIDLDMEVRVSKEELEKATGAPVRLFTLWNDLALIDQVVPRARDAGYLGMLGIGNPFNPPDFDEWHVRRGTVGREMEMWLREPAASMYEHTRDAFPGHLRRETMAGKWLVDITHLVVGRLPKACGEGLWNRCCTPAILDARLREVRDLWGDDVWAATPEDVVEYALMRRAASVETNRPSDGPIVVRVSLGEIPAGVQNRELTFRATVPWGSARVNNGACPCSLADGVVTWTAPVADPATFFLSP